MSMTTILALSKLVIFELYRRKDFYVLFVLTAVITLLLGSVSLFGDDRIIRFLKEICLLLIWISSLVIAISTTARQIPSERENRTIFPLLAKPISRAEVIVGKFMGCWMASGLCLVVFYSFFVLVTGTREHSWPILNYFQALWLHWMLLAVVIAMTLFGSIVFAAPSSNSTICFVVILGILFLARHLNKIALRLSDPLSSIVYSIYFAIPHLEFFDVRDLVVHNLDLVPLDKTILASLYGVAYAVMFLIATWLRFRRISLA